MADCRFVRSPRPLLKKETLRSGGAARSTHLLSPLTMAIFGLLTPAGCVELRPAETQTSGGIVATVTGNDVAKSSCNCVKAGRSATSNNASVTFSDDFANLNSWTLIAPDTPDGRGGPNYNEAGDQWWTNPNNPNTPDPDLYITGDGLRLGLKPTPAGQQAYIDRKAGSHMRFTGALLASYPASYQQYGRWQITAAVPVVPGTSFQADTENVQVTGVWPPEIDLRIWTDGSGAQTVLFAVASNSGTWQWTTSSSSGFDAAVSHTYAWDWEPDTITFYIDNCQVWQIPTPQDGSYNSHPMFLFLLTGANYIGNGDPDPKALTGYHTLVSNVTVYASAAARGLSYPDSR